MDPLALLKRMKHGAFVTQKRAKRLGQVARVSAVDAIGRARQAVGRPYHYFDGRYTRSFLERPDPPYSEGVGCPRIIYTMWFGGPMPANRLHSLDEIRRANPDAEVVLVTETNLDSYLLADHPLHPAFAKLAATHRSDHLRSYLMHFHGGGYTDLKQPRSSWDRAFDRMDADPAILVTGYREVTSNYVSEHPRNLGADLRKFYRYVLGPSAFIMRPQSLFTASLYREQLRRLDYYAPALAGEPPSDPYQLPHSYPMWWGELFPDIVQCLSLKYQDRVWFDDDLRPVLTGYR